MGRKEGGGKRKCGYGGQASPCKSQNSYGKAELDVLVQADSCMRALDENKDLTNTYKHLRFTYQTTYTHLQKR